MTPHHRRAWPLLACIALTACQQHQTVDLTRAWIAQSRQQARLAAATPPADASAAGVTAAATTAIDDDADPFGLAQIAATPLAANTAPTAPVAPDMRALGILRQGPLAQAILQIDGQLLRLKAGEALPSHAGRVLRIGDQEVDVLAGGVKISLPVGPGGRS